MGRFLLQRILGALPTLLGLSLLAFGLIRMVPGDPVLTLLGERGASPEVYQEMKEKMGLHLPLWEQYGLYISKALKGDLGQSVITQRPVIEEFLDRFPATLELGLLSLIMATGLGVPLGMMAAVKRNTIWDFSIMGLSLVGYSMPIFWWGLILILFFSVQLGLTPVSGRISVLYDIDKVTGLMLVDSYLSEDGIKAFWDALKHLLLPAWALGTIPLATIARMTRSSMLEVLGEDYIRTAKAKGLSNLRVIGVHTLRNALIPVITVIGLSFGSIITGAILTETIFSWPGIGKWMVASVSSRDYPVIQGGILIMAVLVVAVNILVDLTYALTNPKMRDQL